MLTPQGRLKKQCTAYPTMFWRQFSSASNQCATEKCDFTHLLALVVNTTTASGYMVSIQEFKFLPVGITFCQIHYLHFKTKRLMLVYFKNLGIGLT